MKKIYTAPDFLEDQVGCVGEYNAASDICTRHCALKLRCVIEYHQNIRLEFIEDIVTSNSAFTKIQ